MSWQTTLGGSPQGIVYPNMKKWSGDHGGYDYKMTAGVLISTKPISQSEARIIDIAPTVLKYFGLTVPKEIDGKSLFSLLLAAALQGQAPGKTAAQAQVSRATERLKILQREADALTAQARTLIAELRKLELDRQIRAEEVARAQASGALGSGAGVGRGPGEAPRGSRQDLATDRRVAAGGSPSWGGPVTGGCCSASTICSPSGGHSGRSRPSCNRIARGSTVHRDARGAGRHEIHACEARRSGRRNARGGATARAALDRAVAAQSARMAEIDARRDLNAQLTGELQEAARRLQASVGGLSADRPVLAMLPVAPFRGDLPWPASGVARSAFGRSRTNRFSTAIQRNGILIGVAEGDRARAVHEGRVAFAGPFTGFATLVIVEHGEGDFSLHGHLRSLAVARGDTVERQAALGETGLTPAGVPGLYFELRIDGQAVDPLQWLKRR